MKKLSALLLGAAIATFSATATPVAAKEFKWAFQADSQGLDPHGLFESFTLSLLGNVYEGLTAYDGELRLVPALATSWENTSPTVWRVNLRKDVKFHNGNDFTADDVIFTFARGLTKGSNLKSLAGLVSKVVKIDDHTIELHTESPKPILMQELAYLYIMNKKWSEENGATEAADIADPNEVGYANRNTNGTGPFMVTDRQPGIKTTFKRFDGYWNKDIKTNVTDVVFTPIKEDATRVAALLSKQVDMVYPVPVQDWDRLDKAEGVRALRGAEARTIFLGMDQGRDELLYSSVKGKNPFKDVRVRKAFAHAINLDAISSRIMRGSSTPAGLMIAPQVNGFNADLNTPYAFDPEMSKKLLAEAGYPDGFTLTMDCPNDRYVNDEKICQAVSSMLGRVGIKVDLLAQTKSKYFAKAGPTVYDTSFYLLGWTPGTMDAHDVYTNLLHCQDAANNLGIFNVGNYCNKRVDEITDLVGTETDQAKRQALIDEGFKIVKDEVGYLPLHQQPLSWGVADNIELVQPASNELNWRTVVVK